MSASILISNLSLATDGVTLTGTLSGGSGTYLPASNLTGFTPAINGVAIGYGASSISGTSFTLALSGTALTGAAVTLDLSASPASNLTDSSGDTPTGQAGVPVTNQSLNWPYGSIADIYAECGQYNTGVFADPDSTSNPTTIITYEQKAGSKAQAQIDRRLSANGFATPTTADPVSMTEIWAKLASYEIYQIRGLNDAASKGGGYSNAFSQKRKDALNALKQMIRDSIFNPGAASAFPMATGQPTATAGGLRTQCGDWYRFGFGWGWGGWGFAEIPLGWGGW